MASIDAIQFIGMSLRDYFAGQALAGMIAVAKEENQMPDMIAFTCYAIADAMLAERAKAEGSK